MSIIIIIVLVNQGECHVVTTSLLVRACCRLVLVAGDPQEDRQNLQPIRKETCKQCNTTHDGNNQNVTKHAIRAACTHHDGDAHDDVQNQVALWLQRCTR